MFQFPISRVTAGLACLVLLAGCAPVQQLQNVAAAGGALANSMVGTAEPTTLNAAQLRQLQTRDYAATKGAAFASVMTVLLDSGYRILSADLESGLITATATTTDRLRLDVAGVARASQTPVASAYIEDRDEGTVRVRLAFSVGTSASGRLGSSGERAVLDDGAYAAFFTLLDAEIRGRPLARPAVPEARQIAPPPAVAPPPIADHPATQGKAAGTGNEADLQTADDESPELEDAATEPVSSQRQVP